MKSFNVNSKDVYKIYLALTKYFLKFVLLLLKNYFLNY